MLNICKNGHVKSDDNIAVVLEKLKDEGIYFTLSFKKMFNSDYVHRIITHTKVKVRLVRTEDRQADFIVYLNRSIVKLNNINFDDLSEVFALTKTTDLLRGSKDKGLFDYIDLQDEEEEDDD